MISNKQSPLKIYVSWDVIFFKTPKLPEHMTVQVDGEIPESKENNSNDNESSELVDSGSKNTEDIPLERELGSESNIEIAEENAEESLPRELCWLKRIKKTPTINNNPRYSKTSYLH